MRDRVRQLFPAKTRDNPEHTDTGVLHCPTQRRSIAIRALGLDPIGKSPHVDIGKHDRLLHLDIPVPCFLIENIPGLGNQPSEPVLFGWTLSVRILIV